ncbi:hypothetical protein U5A82_05875 [Sphingobium sp. CR2-8]|uniref:hypothetical protein n=1 Tax=Sphingobium sp. CR2-8 TaxID=1306534 RepID=UPI002DBE38E3|nr:hypothetical protein [Sphingobium sp. CR2-8]MEC3910019.1 hypothetical protein [Sphingobium sp. CR2-8]
MIGTKTRWIAGTLVSAGLLLGSVSAAEARPRYGYDRGGNWDRGGWNRGGWDRQHRRGDGFGLGDAIGVAAIVGAVAIVANSMNKDKRVRDPNTGGEYDAPPPGDGTDYGADVRNDSPVRDDADFSDIAVQDAAMTDACAVAARDEAQNREGGYAEVRHMETPLATADGYNIDGYVETRTSYRANDGTSRRFTCAMKNGRVADVYLSRDVAAR